MPVEIAQLLMTLSFLGVCALVGNILIEDRKEHAASRSDILQTGE
jgi:hypothetical protein